MSSGGWYRVVGWFWSHSAVRYLVVGGGAFLVDVGLLALLHDVFGVPLVAATPTAFLLSFAVTFLLQRTFTFGTEAGLATSAAKYTALVAFNTVATTGIVAAGSALGLPWIVGKVVAVVSTTVWNYFAYRFWIFARRSRPGR
ncbi:GtrA family protein [Microbacterium sp. ACRRU]|uniref:GtrA family protein n=1 Tax=Microbacterium sp. ACRRU TaxID=2918204 RepID=UPI001EF74A42|nr:GtrA family protein [Microbacterium sp. ACRRU]MCG7418489.1 GtrA family protein [Microbacterium sp. ACRRU]